MNEIKVNVRLSHYTSNVEPHRGAHLEIEDEVSNTRIASITLSPEQVYNLISNSQAKGTAEVLEPEHYAQRVGNRYKWEQIKLDEEFEKLIRFERSVTPEMERIGQWYQVAGGYQGYSWRLHNYGWSLTVWKYEAPDE